MPDALEALRDIHVPDPVSFWPLAYGYWILLLLSVIAIVYAVHRYRKFAIRRAASAELKSLVATFSRDNDEHALARNVNVFLRRTLLTLEPRHEVASLTGNEWLALVENCTQEPQFAFSDRIRALLATDVYRAAPDVDAKRLLKECKRWVRALPPRPAS